MDPARCGCCFGIEQGFGLCDTCRGLGDEVEAALEAYHRALDALAGRHSAHHQVMFGLPVLGESEALAELLAPCACGDCPECRLRADETIPPSRMRWVLARYPDVGFIVRSKELTSICRARRPMVEACFPMVPDAVWDEVLA